MRNDWSFEESGQYSTLAPIQEFVVNLLMSIKQMKINYGGKCIGQKNHMILIERNMK